MTQTGLCCGIQRVPSIPEDAEPSPEIHPMGRSPAGPCSPSTFGFHFEKSNPDPSPNLTAGTLGKGMK